MSSLIGAVTRHEVAPAVVEGLRPLGAGANTNGALLHQRAEVSEGVLAVAHDGEFINDRVIRSMLVAKGYEFDDGANVAAHLIHHFHKQQRWLLRAVRDAVTLLDGQYALAVVAATEPECLVVARHGRPVVIGLGAEGQFVAGDTSSLPAWTRRCIVLADGDVAELRSDDVTVVDRAGHLAVRAPRAYATRWLR